MVSCWFLRKLGGPGAADWWEPGFCVTWQDFMKMGFHSQNLALNWKTVDVTWKHWLIPRVQPTQFKHEAANAVVFMETKSRILTCKHAFYRASHLHTDFVPYGHGLILCLFQNFLKIAELKSRCARVEFEWGFSSFSWNENLPTGGHSLGLRIFLCLWGMVSLPRALDGWVSSLRSPLWIGEWPNASENCWRLAMPSCRCGIPHNHWFSRDRRLESLQVWAYWGMGRIHWTSEMDGWLQELQVSI